MREMRPGKPPLIFLSLVLVFQFGTLILSVKGHDTSLPHHADDFSLDQRAELRTTVILATIIFVIMMGVFIYLAVRNLPEESGDVDDSSHNN